MADTKTFAEEQVGKKQGHWTTKEWDAFTAGWQNQRIGSPQPGMYDERFFEVGKQAAARALKTPE